ncbi:MAG: hypothetical protein MI924_16380 [Chloroflexales bacterium]|nr:hypothetical protein [Chloroflexales bacterium]
MDRRIISRSHIPFWGSWILAHTLGWALTQVFLTGKMGYGVGFIIIGFSIPLILLLSIIGAGWLINSIFIACFGYLEGLVIASLLFGVTALRIRFRWIGAMSLGWPCGWVLGELLGSRCLAYVLSIASPEIAWYCATGAFGAGFGFGLALPFAAMLRLKHAGSWLVWSMLAWTIAWVVAWALPGNVVWIGGVATDRWNTGAWIMQALSIGFIGSSLAGMYAGAVFPQYVYTKSPA